MKSLKNKNIILVGDSISKGLFLDHMSVRRLERNAVDIINETYGILIESHSVFGQTLKRAFEKNLISELPNFFEKDKENVVVIELGGNDADYDWKAVAGSPNEKHFSKTKVGEFKQILKESILFLQNNGAKVVVCSIFPMDSKRYFDSVIKAQANAENVLIFLENDIMNLSRHQEVCNNAIQTIVKETGCAFLDYRSRILLKNDFLTYICEDGIHPNDKGHQYIAKVATDFIENFSFNSWKGFGQKKEHWKRIISQNCEIFLCKNIGFAFLFLFFKKWWW